MISFSVNTRVKKKNLQNCPSTVPLIHLGIRRFISVNYCIISIYDGFKWNPSWEGLNIHEYSG